MNRFLKKINSLAREMIADKFNKKGNDSGIRIAFYGYWISHKKITNQDWFLIFIESLTTQKTAVSWYKTDLIITSVFDDLPVLKILLKYTKTPTLFFSGENLNIDTHLPYKTYLNGLPNLALGFDYDSPNSYRFPLWIMFIFSGTFAATASLEEVHAKLQEIESNSFLQKGSFASMVASHDGLGAVSRSEVTHSLSTISKVSCAGKLLHNDDSLQEKYNDNKKEYLKEFMFNICLENTYASGYVTEKIFESLEAGCIPIYWGDNYPEPEILNPKRIIFWKENSDNEQTVKAIRSLYLNESIREEFLKEPIFVEGAAQAIYHYFLLLRKNIIHLLNNSK